MDLHLIELIIPIVFPVLVGWAMVRFHILDGSDAKSLTNFFLYVAAPALLVSVLARKNPAEMFAPRYTAATIVLMLFQYSLLYLIHRHVLKRTMAESAMAAFTGSKFNAVLLGLPLLLAVLGHEAFGPIVVNVLIGYLTILPLTLMIEQMANLSDEGFGTHLATAVKRALRRAFTFPLMIAAVLGLIMAEAGFQFPRWLDTPLNGLGAAATPTALVAVGMMIAANNHKFPLGEVALMSLFRLVLSPIMAIGMAFMFGLSPVFAVALVVSFSLPTAKMVFALAESYDTYVEEAAGTILVTTVSLIVVFPAVVFLCEWIWPGIVPRH